MTIPVDKLGEAALAVFESIFASKICDFQNKILSLKYFDELDESILSCITDKIKDEYELEKTQDFIQQNPLFLKQKYQFIDDDTKNNFIDSFYKKNPDLRSIGSKRINLCLETYIDKLNELLNNILSPEGKILLSEINTLHSTIIDQVNDTHNDINNQLDEIKKSLSSINGKDFIPVLPFYNIPRKNNLFLGRENTLSELSKKMNEYKISFLTGPGGIGKSQIAREYVTRSKETNAYKSIFWFTANSEDELLEEFNNAALYFHLVQEKCTDPNRIISVLSSFISRHTPSLLIYDGLDDIAINVLVAKYFFQNVNILITTQNSNIDIDEFPVLPVQTFEPEESNSFLLGNTSRRTKTESDNEVVATLSATLEHYPLTLEYARAYINQTHITFDKYLEIYQKNKNDILNSSITSYQKTAYTAWKISFEKVLQQSSNAKDILNMISLLDSFNIPVFDIFLHENLYSQHSLNQAILAITEYSLFTMDGRLANTHGITQEFIRQQMNNDKVYQYYYEKTLKILSDLLPQKITCASERDFVRLISRHVIKLITYANNLYNESTIHLSANIVSKLYSLGNYNEVINFIQEQINHYKGSEYQFRIYEMLIFSIQSHHYIGDDSSAIRIITKYMDIIVSSNELTDLQKWYLLSAYKNIEGIIQKDHGELETCIKSFLEALTFIDKMGIYSEDDQRTNILNNIGNAYRNLYQLDTALTYYQQALDFSHDDKHHLLRIYGNIGLTYKLLEDYEQAMSYFKDALNFSIELGDKRNECIGLEHIANCYLCMHEYDQVLPFLKQSMEIADKMNLPLAKINIYYDYGSLAFSQSNYVDAKQYWQLSLEKSIELDYKKGISLAKQVLSKLPNI